MSSLLAADSLLFLLALGCACATRPWRMLGHGAVHELILPLTAALVALPALWWWPAGAWSPLLSLLGANLVLLTIGWPLAMFVFLLAALWGVVIDQATLGAALATGFWRGALPATLGLGAGWLIRSALPLRPFAFLLGRGFLVPFGSTWIAAILAMWWRDDFMRYADSAVAALSLVALGDALLCGTAITFLVIHAPRSVATWSQKLYVPARSDPGPQPT
jgi:uncharacterized membrane protein